MRTLGLGKRPAVWPYLLLKNNSIALQPGGKVLIGGKFTSINGTASNYIARLVMDEAALQNLSASDGQSVVWTRGGTSPGLHRVSFEIADNLTGSWSMLGAGQRISNGWELAGLYLPTKLIKYIRARGYYSSGLSNGSGSVTESILQVYVPGCGGLSMGTKDVLLRETAARWLVQCDRGST